MGAPIIVGASPIHNLEETRDWCFLRSTYVFRVVQPFLRSSTSKVGSPPAHRQQPLELHGPVALHRLQKSIQHLEIFIFRFQL